MPYVNKFQFVHKFFIETIFALSCFSYAVPPMLHPIATTLNKICIAVIQYLHTA